MSANAGQVVLSNLKGGVNFQGVVDLRAESVPSNEERSESPPASLFPKELAGTSASPEDQARAEGILSNLTETVDHAGRIEQGLQSMSEIVSRLPKVETREASQHQQQLDEAYGRLLDASKYLKIVPDEDPVQ